MANTSFRHFDRPVVMVMTAAIDPGPYADAVTRRDPAVRAGDYVAAVRYWQTYPDPRIAGVVFCDNSGADLADLARRCQPAAGEREVEFLGFHGNDRPTGMHYGYAELGTLDHVLAHSAQLRRAGHFVKVTGRLVFPRLTALLDRHDADLAMSVDSRRSYAREGGPRTRVRTQLMIFETAFYRDHLAASRDEMIDVCTVIEEFLALKAEAFQGMPGVTLRWPIECPPAGIAGNGRDLGSLRQRAKTFGRNVVRRVVPGWWL